MVGFEACPNHGFIHDAIMKHIPRKIGLLREMSQNKRDNQVITYNKMKI